MPASTTRVSAAVTSTLPGLRSWCTAPASWMVVSASASSMPSRRTPSTDSGPHRARTVASDGPGHVLRGQPRHVGLEVAAEQGGDPRAADPGDDLHLLLQAGPEARVGRELGADHADRDPFALVGAAEMDAAGPPDPEHAQHRVGAERPRLHVGLHSRPGRGGGRMPGDHRHVNHPGGVPRDPVPRGFRPGAGRRGRGGARRAGPRAAGPARPGCRARTPGRRAARGARSRAGSPRSPSRGRRTRRARRPWSTWASPNDRTPGVSTTQPPVRGQRQGERRDGGVPALADAADLPTRPVGVRHQRVDQRRLAHARVPDQRGDPPVSAFASSVRAPARRAG